MQLEIEVNCSTRTVAGRISALLALTTITAGVLAISSSVSASIYVPPPTGPSTGPCLVSLLGPVNIYNNASVQASACIIEATTYLYICGNANVTASQLTVGYPSAYEAPYLCSTATIATTPQANNILYSTKPADPLANNSNILAINSHLAAMGNPGWPYGTQSPVPTVKPTIPSGTSRSYSGATATIPEGTKIGNLSVTNSTLTFTGHGAADASCSSPTTISGNVVLSGQSTLIFNSGCYEIGGYIYSANGANTAFKTADGASVKFIIEQYISNYDTSILSFGDGDYTIDQYIINHGAGSLSFGNGQMVVGGTVTNGSSGISNGSMSFGNGPFYFDGGGIINNSGTMRFGDGPFYVWGGSVANAYTGTMIFGDGPFYLYGGTLTNVSGTMTLGDGGLYVQGGGIVSDLGSTTTFGVGNIDVYGGGILIGNYAGLNAYGVATYLPVNVTFGAGGSAANGSGTISMYGGSFSVCYGFTASICNVNAVGETIAVAISPITAGGSVYLEGAGTLNLTAPTAASPTYGYKNILFVEGGAFTLYQTSPVTDTLSGAVYGPSGNVSIYGKETVNSGGCLTFVASVIDIYQYVTLNGGPCL
jgi:hypothetical protein